MTTHDKCRLRFIIKMLVFVDLFTFNHTTCFQCLRQINSDQVKQSKCKFASSTEMFNTSHIKTKSKCI